MIKWKVFIMACFTHFYDMGLGVVLIISACITHLNVSTKYCMLRVWLKSRYILLTTM